MNDTAHNNLVRELDCRTNDGIEVRLLWDQLTTQVWVSVSDTRSGESFRSPVAAADARDAFHHPGSVCQRRPRYSRPCGVTLTALTPFAERSCRQSWSTSRSRRARRSDRGGSRARRSCDPCRKARLLRVAPRPHRSRGQDAGLPAPRPPGSKPLSAYRAVSPPVQQCSVGSRQRHI